MRVKLYSSKSKEILKKLIKDAEEGERILQRYKIREEEMKTIYDIFRIGDKEKREIEYLLTQCFKLGIDLEVQESLFQFSPNLVKEKVEGFGEHEPWSIFFKRTLIHEILFFCVENIIKGDYNKEEMISDIVWDDSKYIPFILKNDFLGLDKEDILELFKEYIIEKGLI
jgi:hypothetical protein